jgi:hypothetical protein
LSRNTKSVSRTGWRSALVIGLAAEEQTGNIVLYDYIIEDFAIFEYHTFLLNSEGSEDIIITTTSDTMHSSNNKSTDNSNVTKR